MKNNKNKTSLFKSIGNMFANLFTNNITINSDAVLSPSQQIKKNFFENKLGVIGLVGFITIFLVVFGGTTLGGHYNEFEHEPALQNISPGRNFLKIDKNLKDPVKISSGVSFTVALDESGKVYFWGKNPSYNARVSEIIEKTKDKTIVDIAAGTRHVIALTSTGEIIGAGLNNFKQAEMTSELKIDLMGEKVSRIEAGPNISVVHTESNKIFVWGSTLASGLDSIPRRFQGRIVDFEMAPFNLMLILDDGTLATVGISGSAIVTSMPQELKDGSVNVVQVAVADTAALALDDQGNLYAWGNMSGLSLSNLPDVEGNIVQIDATSKTFNILSDLGEITTIGTGKYGLESVPSKVSKLTTEKIYSGDYAVYAISDTGVINAWGLDGFRLGSDNLGRDTAERLLYGGRISLTVGAVAIVISLLIGVSVGLIAGFYGGWIDNLLMRVAEVVSAFPFMPLAITLSALLPSEVSQSTRLLLIMFILGVISWPGTARFVRGQILAERERDFVLAARALGLKESTIILKHILPSVFNLIIVNMTLGYASSLLTEAGLSYLGFGVKAPSPSWGNMLNGVVNSIIIERFWWQWLLPAMAVLLTALSVNLIGDALRDAMDPRSNQK